MSGLILPLVIGALGVLQNSLNRHFAPALGLGWVLLVNGTVLFVCGILFMVAIRILPAELLPGIYRPHPSPRSFSFYDPLPGIFGF